MKSHNNSNPELSGASYYVINNKIVSRWNRIVTREDLGSNRGLSPVIATVVLAGVVLSIGGALWSYSLGAATVTADNYINDTFDMLHEMQERFDVEHAHYDSSTDELKIWIFNYGEVDITIDVYASLNSSISKTSLGSSISASNTTRIDIDFSSNPIPSQEQVAIKVYSRRQNIAYYTYYVQ